jgi:hypothetical protein
MGPEAVCLSKPPQIGPIDCYLSIISNFEFHESDTYFTQFNIPQSLYS